MSRPRKPFGANQPGRLPSTMMKVLAAEMSDPQRLKRGKQYWKQGSVTDIVVEAGVVTCEIQGSRSTPYVASLEVTSGNGMPLRRDLWARCTCPDDTNNDGHACKHVLATMFTFAEELLIEPELLDVWRNNERSGDADESSEPDDAHDDTSTDDDAVETFGRPTLRSVSSFDPDDDEPSASNRLRQRRRRFGSFDEMVDDDEGRSIHDDEIDDDIDDDAFDDEIDDGRASLARRRRHLRLVREGIEQGRAERRDAQARRREPAVDPLADLLAIPDGAVLPDVTVVDAATDEVMPRNDELAAIVRDAYRHLRIDWD